MKTTHIAAACIISLVGTGAFAQTPATTNQLPGPGVHKANIELAPQDAVVMKQNKKAEHKAAMSMMTPDERKTFKADRRAKKAARLAAMTPEQRKAYDDRKAQKKAERKKVK